MFSRYGTPDTGWTCRPPKDKGWTEPVAVVEGEVWANVQHVPGTSSAVGTIVRLPIAALGAPQP